MQVVLERDGALTGSAFGNERDSRNCIPIVKGDVGNIKRHRIHVEAGFGHAFDDSRFHSFLVIDVFSTTHKVEERNRK
jgi:hypothetical protein